VGVGKRIAIWTVLLLGLVGYGIYWGIYDIQRLCGEEKISTAISPDGNYTVTAYRNNGGATTDYAILCNVENNETGKKRNIYWNYRCDSAYMEWTDENTVMINGIELDVTKDSYDYRRD